ncbi:Cj0814 family flagellar-dependent secreted protein, partial [Campylobacter concisus]|uniref:Cj0814 family flagellar-dependent secreted protein n=1 Tax=Campylobacter concisus TaxID=199 RepID=UPI003982A663
MNDISILSTNVNSYTKQQHKQNRSLNFSDIFNQKTKEKISEPSQEPAKFTYTTSSQNSLASLNFYNLQAYGYTVDKAGFMGADFNKAAGLPQDFKIHKSTLDELSRFAEHNHVLNRIKSKDEQI